VTAGDGRTVTVTAPAADVANGAIVPADRPDVRARPPATDIARRWSLRRWFAVGGTVTALLVVLGIGVGGFALARLTEARGALLDEVAPALEAGQELSVALLDQETGVRGFDLSGRPEFLDPYRAGLAGEQEAAATLRRLASAGASDQLEDDVADVLRAARTWRSGFAEPIVAAGATPGAEGVDPVRGRELFTEVRRAVDVLIDDLRAEQLAARQRVADAAAFVLGVWIAIAVVLVGFLALAGIGLRRGVLAPVSELAGQVREVVSGDTAQRVSAGGPREIVELSEDVESMRTHILRELARVQEVGRRLDEQARELERSNRDLEQFAYVASHDLQEPLRKVSSFCQLLQRRYGGQLDDRADQYIEFAVDGALRMQRLINDLLALSRVGRSTEGFVKVDLTATAHAAVSQLEAARGEVGGEVRVGALPTVPGDPVLLRQLLVNLVGNGLKFHRDGVPPVVDVSARRDGGGWEVSVADNGIGIEPEYADKVFVIFQRLHGREVYPGTGIGLALAKKIVEFHGGMIRLDRGAAQGTTVRFTLPTAAAPTGSRKETS